MGKQLAVDGSTRGVFAEVEGGDEVLRRDATKPDGAASERRPKIKSLRKVSISRGRE